jgi:hypothetical protein
MKDAAKSRRWPPQDSWQGLLPPGDPTARFEGGQAPSTPRQSVNQRHRTRSAARSSDWWLPLAMVAAAAALLGGSLWWLQRSTSRSESIAQTDSPDQGLAPASGGDSGSQPQSGVNRATSAGATDATRRTAPIGTDAGPASSAERPRFDRSGDLSAQPLDMPEDFTAARPMNPVFEPGSDPQPPPPPLDAAAPNENPPFGSAEPIEPTDSDGMLRWEAWQQTEDRLAEALVLPQPERWGQRLVEAEPDATDPPQLHQQWAAWKQLGESYRRYLDAVQAAIDRLGAGEQLELPSGQIYGVVEASAEELVLRARGQNRSWQRHSLPPAISLALADLQLDSSRPADLLARGLFCWVDPQSNPLLQTRGLAWLQEAHRQQPLSAELLELLGRRFAFPTDQLAD